MNPSSHSDRSETRCSDVLGECLSSTRFKLFSTRATGKEKLTTTLTEIVFDEDLLKNRDNEFACHLLLEALMLLSKLHRQEQTLLDGARSVYIYSDEKEKYLTHWCRKDVLKNALFQDTSKYGDLQEGQLLLKLVKQNVKKQSQDIVEQLDKRREDLFLGCKEAHPLILNFTQKIFHSTCEYSSLC